MKLKKIHLFVLLIFVLMASTFGWTVREYMTGDKKEEEEPESEDILPGRGGRQPFLPGVPTPRPKRRRCIPQGDEDYYVLKSQVVPPVCPKCPDTRACPRQKKCPPCPAPKRCPEPAFECKKVPNYNVAGGAFGNNSAGESVYSGANGGANGGGDGSSNSTGAGGAPMPRLNSFSQF